MSRARFDNLEVLARMPVHASKARQTPLLFVHGAYTGAWCWEDTFLPYFAEAGYPCYAISLSGHAGSRGHEILDVLSIADYVADVASVVERLPVPPVLIGHSMGGFVVQRYLERATAPAAALLCSVPPQGLLTSAFGVLIYRPDMMRELNAVMGGGPMDLDMVERMLFAQPIARARIKAFALRAQKESLRALWDMTLPTIPNTNAIVRTPLLVLGGECDQLIPPALVMATARTFHQGCDILPGLGHGFMQESGWRVPAERLLAWLTACVPQ